MAGGTVTVRFSGPAVIAGAGQVDPAVASPDYPATARQAGELRGVLDRRAAAFRQHDRARWLADIDPAATAFRARQAAVLANAASVPFSVWQYVLDAGQAGPRPGAQLWTVRVTLHYAFSRVDPLPTDQPQVLTFHLRAGRWLLRSDTGRTADGTRTWRGPWDAGPLVVRLGRNCMVLAHPAHAGELATFAAAVDAAIPRVTAVWGTRWQRLIAVFIPDSQQEMGTVVGSRFALTRIAAVAIADRVDTATGRAWGQRILVNPANLDRLGTLGRQVVLEHELAHVAARGITGSGMPVWLVEGFADYVGYRDSDLPTVLIARDLRSEIRAGSWPGKLPGDRDFLGNSARLSVAYEEAWFACRLVVKRVGVTGLLRLYRLVGTSAQPATAMDGAVRRVLGESLARFVVDWRDAAGRELGWSG